MLPLFLPPDSSQLLHIRERSCWSTDRGRLLAQFPSKLRPLSSMEHYSNNHRSSFATTLALDRRKIGHWASGKGSRTDSYLRVAEDRRGRPVQNQRSGPCS